MYRFVGGRGTGKTYHLLQKANETQGIVVCSNPRAMREKARAWGFDEIKDFISFREARAANNDPYSMYLDDIEKFLSEEFGQRIQGYTYTFEENEN
jgi:hypothetical protein